MVELGAKVELPGGALVMAGVYLAIRSEAKRAVKAG
jgi:hypothetical protein